MELLRGKAIPVMTPSTSTRPLVPVLHISAGRLRAQAGTFLAGFPGSTSFAVKSNAHPCVIRYLGASGITTFDVASLQEIETVRSVMPEAVLHYHNPVRSTDETATALFEHGCKRFAIDHEEELFKLAALAPDPSVIEVGIRFRSDEPSMAVQAFKSKFGASPLQAARLMSLASGMGFMTGLNFHPGSQLLEPEAYVSHIMLAARISRSAGRFPAFLNVGGGFPGHYEGLAIPDPDVYFRAIGEAADAAFGRETVSLECEPGRGLVAGAGTLETHVKAVRRQAREVFLDDGIYGGLMEVHQFAALEPVVELRGRKSKTGPELPWTAYGPTCDPVDVLPFRLLLPEDLAEGDTICFHGTGAYSTATATRFNGYGAIEVRCI